MLKKPVAIFFDWDGTLVDSFSFLEAAHNHVLEFYGLSPFSKGGFMEYFGKPREEIYPALYGDKSDEARVRFEAFVVDHHKAILEPIAGAFDLVKTVHDLSIDAGVVSNKKTEFVNAEIDHFEWRYFFKAIIGAREAEEDKPSPAPLLMGLERAGIIAADMADIWYVGDTVIDQECARRAGATFVYLNHHEEIDNDVLRGAPDLVFNNCQIMAGFLLQYKGN